jgi:uncharacterized protein YndB with AHSA1/START domain
MATQKQPITVTTTVKAPIEKVWKYWTHPEHITQWNNASDDWFTPHASNDLRPEGKFNFRMEARDGSFGFDFDGIYNAVKEHEIIEYSIIDGRKVSIRFESDGSQTTITETFEAENENSTELQQKGWQSILDNFKKYTESN